MAAADYIIVGSGINALVARPNWAEGPQGLVLERNDRIGGCIRTEEITEPGYIHDVMATTFVLFITSPAFAELGPELEGAAWRSQHSPSRPRAMPDGRHWILSMDREGECRRLRSSWRPATASAFPPISDRRRDAPFLFAMLGGSLWTARCSKIARARSLAAGLARARGLSRRGAPHRAGVARDAYQSDVVQALFAPWVLHAGLGPESAFSGADGQGDRLCARSRRRADRERRRARSSSRPSSA